MDATQFSRDELRILREVVREHRTRSRSTTDRPAVAEYDVTLMAPEVYVAQVGEEGIPSAVPASSQRLDPGVAQCPIFHLNSDEAFGEYVQVDDFQHRIFNISTSQVAPNSWVPVWRDKYGNWFTNATSNPYNVTYYSTSPQPTRVTGTGTGSLPFGTGTGEPLCIDTITNISYPPACPPDDVTNNFYQYQQLNFVVQSNVTGTGTAGTTPVLNELTYFIQIVDSYTSIIQLGPGPRARTGTGTDDEDIPDDTFVIQQTITPLYMLFDLMFGGGGTGTGTGDAGSSVRVQPDGLGGIAIVGAGIALAGSLASAGERTEEVLAATGTTQGTAAAITGDAVHVNFTDASNDGVRLKDQTAAIIIVWNDTVNTLKVYPPSGAKIDLLADNAPYELVIGKTMFVRVTATQWWAFP